MPSVALAVVGSAVPVWGERLTQVRLVDPALPEEGLNECLRSMRAPFLLPVQAEDHLNPDVILGLARALASAPASYLCAAAEVDQIRRDGTRRRVPAVGLAGTRALLTTSRLPTPILFRTSALRSIGGWRPGDACWEHRSRRHRGLLYRLLSRGALLARSEYLGVVARAQQQGGAPGTLTETLCQLRFRPVTLEGPGLRLTGRIAAISPGLVTLVEGDHPITLVPTSKITAVQADRHDRLS